MAAGVAAAAYACPSGGYDGAGNAAEPGVAVAALGIVVVDAQAALAGVAADGFFAAAGVAVGPACVKR